MGDAALPVLEFGSGVKSEAREGLVILLMRCMNSTRKEMASFVKFVQVFA